MAVYGNAAIQSKRQSRSAGQAAVRRDAGSQKDHVRSEPLA